MFIAGRESWKISIDEPQVLLIALYIRDVEALRPPPLDSPAIPRVPALDPSITVWPAWTRPPRPEEVAPIGPTLRSGQLDRAAEQWSHWWRHAVTTGASALADLNTPGLSAFGALPELRILLRQHVAVATRWSDAVQGDPRVKQVLSAPVYLLNDLVAELEFGLHRQVRHFDLRLTVLPVASKHAWVIAPDHLLITRHLLQDTENAIDWLRPRIRALA